MNKHVTHVHRRHNQVHCRSLSLFLSHPAHNTNANGMLLSVLMKQKSLVFYE